MAVIIALPAATPKELMNDASFALGAFTNRTYSNSLLQLYSHSLAQSQRMDQRLCVHSEFPRTLMVDL